MSHRWFYVILITIVILVFALNLALGSIEVTPRQLLTVLIGGNIDNPVLETVVLQIRLPRTIAALVGGAALAVAGLLLQIFFRNAVVDSFVLGIASGSGLMVGLVLLAGVSFGLQSHPSGLIFLAALAGALGVMFLVMAFARRTQDLVALLVVGLILGYLCSAANSFLMAFAEKEQLQTYIHWTMGSFSGFTWTQAKVLFWVALPTIATALLLCKPLNALLLGDDYARSLGLNLVKVRGQIIGVTSILTAIVTAYAGPVAFIGLAVPHLGRLLFRTADNRILIPAVILLGAGVTGICDLAARSLLAPVELPLTAVTSCFGAPLLIYLILRRQSSQ